MIRRHASEWIADSGNRRQNPAETPMTAITHLLNIGTLAAWLSVTLFGAVAVVFPADPDRPSKAVPGEINVSDADVQLGGEASAPPAMPETEPASPDIPEPLPAPPDLPAVAEIEPLPAVPAFPAITENQSPAETSEIKPTTNKVLASRTSRQGGRQSSATGRTGAGKPGTEASGMSNASRIAAGRMPAPSYPAEARRKGQSGTVVVQFTVDASGRVTYANAISPSPWPLLNQAAVRGVMLWRFPPGDFILLERPIVFRLK